MNQLSTHISGYPRIGAKRELKWALEKYWSQKSTEHDLLDVAKRLRRRHWEEQFEAGLDFVTTNDFSLYDHVLDMACTFGMIPKRFQWAGGDIPLDLYFSLARGNQDSPALALTKWFNTNYHYLVPELSDDVPFSLQADRILAEFLEARDLGYQAKPVIVGPVTLLSLSQPATSKDVKESLERLHELLPFYAELLRKLKQVGAEWVQLDEPVLSTKLNTLQRRGLCDAYKYLAKHTDGINILLATYFGKCAGNANLMLTLPVAGIHADAVSAPEDVLVLARYLKPGMVLSVGLVDGRNIWVNDLKKAKEYLAQVREHVADEKLWLSSSCSLHYVPHTLALEEGIPSQIRPWLSFAREKLAEIVLLSEAFGSRYDEDAFLENQKVLNDRHRVEGVCVKEVRSRVKEEIPQLNLHRTPYRERCVLQAKELGLPLLPTTTIGSFPQTKEVRGRRAQFKKGELSYSQYEGFLREEIRQCIQRQEEVGLDVLVHGEFERNDMVEYFASGLEGFCVTDFGWVQSYGSRCTKPPILWGDVSRGSPITLRWTNYAQSLTDKPLKGMLTGTTTILQWSFIRDDLPRREVSQQIALALRDEVLGLEESGVKVIQLDEAALREGLPLEEGEREGYLEEALESFLITTSVVQDSTQIHTHMCYSQFKEIFQTIIALDADVISIETTRGRMGLLDQFKQSDYPNEIGPGVWDIHSPRVPAEEEMVALLKEALKFIPVDRLWVNPDCGLKTRAWPETMKSLTHLVAAAQTVREDCMALTACDH